MTDKASTIRVAHRIRLNPTPEQVGYFVRAAGIARFVWNVTLREYKLAKSLGQRADWNEIKKAFRLRIDADFPFVREVTKCASEGAIADLRRAIATYYKAKPGNPKLRFPGPRRRSRGIGGFVLNNDQFWTDGHDVRVPRCGLVNMAEPLRFSGKVLGGRIKERAGRWYLTVVVECAKPSASHGIESVGIDFGLSRLVTLSTGETCETQACFRRSERKLRALQRGLARKKKGSNRRKKWKLRIARLHERIANQRSDFTHKLTTNLVNKCALISVEDLSLKGLCRTRLGKSFHDAAIGEAIRQLDYKCEWRTVALQRVDRFFPSSKRCHACGLVNDKLTLADRVWTCPCGAVHDRDLNASFNIKQEGERLLAGSSFVGVTPVEFAASTSGFGQGQAADCEAGTEVDSLLSTF